MKKLIVLLLVLVSLLSLAAGGAKVAQVPNEVAFLMGFGLSQTHITIFGVLQILGGILSLFAKTRRLGLWLVLVMFLASAGLVFASGDVPFGLISLLPVLVVCILIYNSKKSQTSNS